MIQALADAMNERVERVTRFVDSLPKAPTNRAVGLALAAPSGAVLGIARWLDPSPKGYGTHLQLGLGECTMMHLTGYPCPMCGMTTAFSLYADLRPVDAFLNQPFGLVLFTATLLAFIIGVSDLITGRGLWRRALAAVDRRESLVAGVLLVGMLVGWIYKVIALHPELVGA
jgi:hypothetical protein